MTRQEKIDAIVRSRVENFDLRDFLRSYETDTEEELKEMNDSDLDTLFDEEIGDDDENDLLPRE